ncbi:MAG: ADP-forming succinate--CoA ligase subunit beta [Desulfurococcaceae archaeon]
MKLYEHEAKEIASKYGVPVPRSRLACTPEEAYRAASEIGPVVVKAQVLVGGRGLAGGIKKASTPEEAAEAARMLLGSHIRGEKVSSLLVEEIVCTQKELYLSLTVDRATRKLVYIVSEMGGVEVEEIAKKHPDRVYMIHVDPEVGYTEYMSRVALTALRQSWGMLQDLAALMRSMYRIMLDYDAELVEFNPLAVTCNSKLMPLDAKIVIDDNSLHKHPEFQRNYGRELKEYERKAKELGFSYVEFDGDIGIISNGAGLTMATMDLILHYGAIPANFLDIGGGGSKERVKEAVKLMLEHPRPKVLLVNIFGGITRCDEVALGVVEALKETGTTKPVVVRMLGTNEEEGRRVLLENNVPVHVEMEDAVKAAVELSRGRL